MMGVFKKTGPSQADLQRLFQYEPSTGVFTRIVTVALSAQAGMVAGYNTPMGYLTITVMGRSYFAHRLAWMYVHGRAPADEIDHINGVKSDNRIENLREVSKSLNQANVGIQRNNTSGFKGVAACRLKWSASIQVNKVRHRLGNFDTKEQAAKAYAAAAHRLFGEFARVA